MPFLTDTAKLAYLKTRQHQEDTPQGIRLAFLSGARAAGVTPSTFITLAVDRHSQLRDEDQKVAAFDPAGVTLEKLTGALHKLIRKEPLHPKEQRLFEHTPEGTWKVPTALLRVAQFHHIKGDAHTRSIAEEFFATFTQADKLVEGLQDKRLEPAMI